MARAGLAILLVLAAAAPVRAEDAPAAVADRLLENLRGFSGVPGHAAAVVLDGEVVWTGESGLADIDASRPVGASSRFRLASVSKLYTATLLLKLAASGRADLDADVGHYVSEWPERDEGTITLRQLAAHTSGIPHYGRPGTRRPDADVRVARTAEALAFFRDAPLEHPPNEAYTYSSYGYALLAAAAAAITGESFPRALAKELLEPAGLEETEVEDVDALPSDAVHLYDIEGSGGAAEVAPNDQSYVWGATGMRASARDVARFGHAFVSGSIVPPSVVSEALTPVTLANDSPAGIGRFHVGFGWRVGRDWNGRPVAHHAGLTPGARSILLAYPADGAAVSLLSNATWTSRMETTAELLAAPFLDPDDEAAPQCIARTYRVHGTFDGEDEAGTLEVAADGPVCIATLGSEAALAERFSAEVFPAVRVASHGDERVFAVAYPWGLAALTLTHVGDIVAIVGDFAGRSISLRGVTTPAQAARSRVELDFDQQELLDPRNGGLDTRE